MYRVSSTATSASIAPGARVRLRHRPDDTGTVTGLGWLAGEVKVRGDDSGDVTYISVGQLEAVSELRPVE
jgi:hypothetical protein